MQDNQLYDRVRGCLLGVAAGDAMGQARRGMDWRLVQETYGRIQNFAPWPPDVQPHHQKPAGHAGDLARLAVLLAERTGRSGQRPRTSLLIDELFAQGAALDSLPAQAALTRIHAGIEPSRSAVPELAGPEALYVAISVAIGNIGDPEAAFLAARSIAGPILLGPSLEAGQVFAAAVAAALMPGARPSDCMEAALDLAPPSIARTLQPAARFAREHLGDPCSVLMPVIHDRFAARTGDSHGPTVESLAVGLMLLYVNDGFPEQSICTAAAYGGLSHATAAAAGALAGAISGASAFPREWARLVEIANPDLHFESAAKLMCRVIALEGNRQKQRILQIEEMGQQQPKAA